MRKTVLTVLALLATSVAYATDLPKKDAAPTAAAPAASAPNTTVAVESGFQTDVSDVTNPTAYGVGVKALQQLGGGLFVGVNAKSAQVAGQGAISGNLEGIAGYKMPALWGFSFVGAGGVGERFTSGKNFPYYVLSTGTEYKINEVIAVNPGLYRYRNSFDAVNDYESHQLGLGASYTFAKNQAVYANAYRNFDKSFNATSNEVSFGYKIAF